MIGKDVWYDFNLLKFSKICSLTYDLLWRLFCVLLRGICILLLLDGLLCICLLGPFGIKYIPNLIGPYWFYVWKIYLLLQVGIEVPQYYCIGVYFYLKTCYYLLNIFRYFNLCWIYIYHCYILLWIDLFIIIKGPSFSLIMVPGLKSIFYDESSLLISNCMEYIFPSLHFESICDLKTEVTLVCISYSYVLFLHSFSHSMYFIWRI